MFNLFLRSNKEAPASTTEHAVESRDDQDSMMTTAPKLQDQPFHQSPHQKANVTSDMHTMTTAATTSSSSEEVNQITAGETSNKAAATESVIEVKQPRIKTPVKIDDNMKGGGQTPDFKTKKGKGKNVSRKKIDLTKAAKKI